MVLLYLLFALTAAMVLTALCAPRVPEQRQGEAFIAFFILFLLAAWAVDEWVVPAAQAGRGLPWLPALSVVVFSAILIVSAFLSVRLPGGLAWARGPHGSRQEAEAAAFDILLWLLMLIFGIVVMRRLGL